jgi:iron complex outermembrane recepter protein
MTNHIDDNRRRFRSPVHRAVAAALALAPVALLGSPGATAQDNAAAVGLEEIVVTARKTEEKLTEVPLSIAAYSSEDIIKRNATTLSDIAQYTAGFSYEAYSGGSTPAPLIRGLTQNALTDRNQNVGTFVDGVHVQQQGNIDFSLLDLERVEIVKGPQNAQYGRSSFAGAINWVPRKPVLGEWDGFVSATYGTDEREDLQASVNLPVWSDKLAIRVAGTITKFDGTWENNFAGARGANALRTTTQGFTFEGTSGNLGGYDNESRQASLRFRPIESLTLDLMYYRSETQNDVGASYTIQPRAPRQTPTLGGTNPLNCSPRIAADNIITGFPAGTNQLLCGEMQLDKSRISADPRGSGTETHSDLMIGRLEYQFSDNLSATYVYGRGLYDASNFGPAGNIPEIILFGEANQPQPGTGNPSIQFAANPITNQESKSNEIRFDGKFGQIGWRLGYYTNKVDDVGAAGLIERRLPLSLDPTGQVFFAQTLLVSPASGFTRFQDETTAQFGAITVPFLDTWTMEAEARYAKEERRQIPLNGGFRPTPREFSEFTPRVNLKWQPRAGWMFYGSVAKGIKPGGFNIQTADEPTFEPEENLTFELGAKQSLMEGRLQANYSIFLIDWKDLQLSVPDTIPNPLQPLVQQPNFIGNVSGAEAKGIEVELIALATDRLRVNFAGSYVQSTFDDDVIDTTFGRLCETNGTSVCTFLPRQGVGSALPLGGSPIGGNDLPRTPRTKASLGLEYTIPLTTWELSLRGDLNYQSKYYIENLNLAYIPDRTLLNMNVALVDEDGKWLVNFWGKNMTDELYASSAFAVSVINQYGPALGYGRTAGVTVRYSF